MRAEYFYYSLISFLCGVAMQTVASFSLPTITWVGFLSLIPLLSIVKQKSEPSTRFYVAACTIIFFALGMLRFEMASWQFGNSQLTPYVNTSVVLQGTVTKEPEQRARGLQVLVDVGEERVLVTADSFSTIAYGDTVRVRGELAVPESFSTDLGREFNYPAYLLVRGVEYMVRQGEVEVVSSQGGNPLLSFLLTQKNTLIQGIEAVIPSPESGLGLGLLLGVKQALGEDLEAAFRTSGLTHIIVLSGYNVMLVVTFVLFCLSFLLPLRARIIVGLVAIVCFALIVGLSATVVRASVMASLLLIAQLLGRTYDLMRALLLAGVVMVCINPYLLIYDIGFQLSFMATLGLILIAPKLESFVQGGFATLSLKDFLFSTLATQIAVLPLLLYHIGEMSLVAVVVNVLVLPVVPLAMLTTFVAGVMAVVFEPLGLMLSFLAYLSLTYIIHIATFFSSLPFASVTVPTFSVWWVGVMYAGLGYILFVRKKQTVSIADMSDWLIEEEKTNEVRSTSSVKSTTPVFFR